MKQNEKGALVIEAAFVFPVMFFVLLFLIYMGNMFYMRSRVDVIAGNAAVEAAAKCADPMLSEVEESGAVPKQINDVKPYHSLLCDTAGMAEVKRKAEQKLKGLGTGFFAGMGVRDYTVNLKYENHIFYADIIADIDYKINFPIRFLGDDQPVVLQMHSRSVAPVTDTAEFIQNVDMAIDYSDASGLTEKLNNLASKVKQFFGHR